MGINVETARKAEEVARRICRERGMPEGLWQMVLMEAYDELVPAITREEEDDE